MGAWGDAGARVCACAPAELSLSLSTVKLCNAGRVRAAVTLSTCTPVCTPFLVVYMINETRQHVNLCCVLNIWARS
jgi:hypothetical protein